MDRIRDIRPLGSPHAVYVNAPQLVERLLGNAVAGPNGCLIWTAHTDRDGYGAAKNARRTIRAHRAIYQLLVEPLDGTRVVDHLCHNEDAACPGGRKCLHRRCINPYHLDAVTNRENLYRSSLAPSVLNARKTHCPQGHPYDAENTRMHLNRRYCRECGRAQCRKYGRRIRAEKLAAVTA